MSVWTRLWQAFFPPSPPPPTPRKPRGANKPRAQAGKQYTAEQWEILKTAKASDTKKLARAWGRTRQAISTARKRVRMGQANPHPPVVPAPLRAVRRGGESHADGLY